VEVGVAQAQDGRCKAEADHLITLKKQRQKQAIAHLKMPLPAD
jgi:hypothetical protein